MLAEFEKHKNLLSVMLLLFLVKFAVYPVLDWQAELTTNNLIKQKKANKIAKLINKEQQLNETEASVAKGLTELESYFFRQSNVAKFKLQQQQKLEQLAKKYKLKISNIGWNPTTKMSSNLLTEQKVRLDIKGLTENVAQFIWVIEQQKPQINIKKLSVGIRAQDDHLMGLATSHLELQYFILVQQNTGKA